MSENPDASAALREGLAGWVEGLAQGRVPLVLAQPCEIRSAGAGHFHLAPELFLQAAGTTRFRFPDGAVTLGPGQALLLPPRLLHAERVQRGPRGEPFRNLVIYADGGRFSCHAAHEVASGRPGIAHLEARVDAQAQRVHDWLAEAARLAPEQADPLAAAQARALVVAAAAGVLRALAAPARESADEPPAIARLRVMVQNRLGDASLSVRELARHAGCTPDHLSAVFARRTGERLAAYIARLRLERAARLLRETSMSVKEVAWACGYATPSYFVRSFGAHHGCTPLAFRRRSAD